jgi:hypothetical protein
MSGVDSGTIVAIVCFISSGLDWDTLRKDMALSCFISDPSAICALICAHLVLKQLFEPPNKNNPTACIPCFKLRLLVLFCGPLDAIL